MNDRVRRESLGTRAAVRNAVAVVIALTWVVAAQAPVAAQTAADSAATRARAQRASWTSDRFALQVGDIVTVVVDEQTAARERVSKIATANRSQRAKLSMVMDAESMIDADFGTGNDAGSRDVGEAGRQGDLTAVLSVRITAIEPNGLLRIAGSKTVAVDGRQQNVAVQGVIRSEDISPARWVLSSRIADAVITYKGKTIGPRMGIVGKILGILWP